MHAPRGQLMAANTRVHEASAAGVLNNSVACCAPLTSRCLTPVQSHVVREMIE